MMRSLMSTNYPKTDELLAAIAVWTRPLTEHIDGAGHVDELSDKSGLTKRPLPLKPGCPEVALPRANAC